MISDNRENLARVYECDLEVNRAFRKITMWIFFFFFLLCDFYHWKL